MLCFRALLALGLVSAALTGAQPPTPPPTYPLVDALLPYIGDEGVQKELKLSAEQTKKLLAYRQKLWDAEYTTASKDLDAAAQGKATEAEFKAVLSAEQLARANQLAAQFVWTTRFGGFNPFGVGGSVIAPPPLDPRTVAASSASLYPALADALGLDDAQKKLAGTTNAGGGWGGPNGVPVVYLTPKQSDAAKRFLGAEYKAVPTAQYDPRDNGFNRFGGSSPALQYLGAPDVQKELKLTAEQMKTANELWAKYIQQPGGFPVTTVVLPDFNATSPAERAKASAKQQADATAALDKLLAPAQRQRLDQIVRQNSGPRNGQRVTGVFTGVGELATELAVTDEQRKAFGKLQAAHSDAVAKAVLSGEPVEQVRATVDAAEQAFDKAARALLTAEQAAKYTELVGEPFAGSVYGGNPGFGVSAATRRKLTFGRYGTQLNVLANYKGVQDALKLTDEQKEKVTAALADLRTKFSPLGLNAAAAADEKKADALFADRSAFVAKALADVLTKEQAARFRALDLQRVEAGSTGFGISDTNLAAGYPGVAEALKLTAEQKQKLIDGTPQADVLTDDQKKALKGMQGEPAEVAKMFAPPVGGPGGSGGFPNALPALTPSYQLLLNVRVWDGLKLTPDQLAKLVPAANAYQLVAVRRNPFGGGFGPGFPGGPPGGPAQPTAEEVTTANTAFTAAADAALTAGQKQRLGQLAVQQSAANGLDAALTTDLGKALAVTDAQQQAVQARCQEFSELAFLLNNVAMAWDKGQAVRTQLGERLDAAVLKELTAEQQAKLKGLTGEPSDAFPRQPLYYRFGGGGGFRP